MAKHLLRTPIKKEEVRRMRVGDEIYIDGEIFTARDSAHRRILHYYAQGKKLPKDMVEKPLYHCGPLVKKLDGVYEVVSAGPTTSMRMEAFEDEVIERLGIPIVIGKGGMGSRTVEAMKKFGSVYCAFTGGAGALAGEAIKRVKSVKWLDLGMPEALWFFEVKGFGPLIVAIDCDGRNLYEEVSKKVDFKRRHIYEKMGFSTS